MAKLKVYMACNADGNNMAMVAAVNLKEAARLFGTSLHDLRSYGWRIITNDDAAISMAKPGKVFYKALSWESEWSERRHFRNPE